MTFSLRDSARYWVIINQLLAKTFCNLDIIIEVKLTILEEEVGAFYNSLLSFLYHFTSTHLELPFHSTLDANSLLNIFCPERDTAKTNLFKTITQYFN
jgi:hypothetical protein